MRLITSSQDVSAAAHGDRNGFASVPRAVYEAWRYQPSQRQQLQARKGLVFWCSHTECNAFVSFSFSPKGRVRQVSRFCRLAWKGDGRIIKAWRVVSSRSMATWREHNLGTHGTSTTHSGTQLALFLPFSRHFHSPESKRYAEPPNVTTFALKDFVFYFCPLSVDCHSPVQCEARKRQNSKQRIASNSSSGFPVGIREHQMTTWILHPEEASLATWQRNILPIPLMRQVQFFTSQNSQWYAGSDQITPYMTLGIGLEPNQPSLTQLITENGRYFTLNHMRLWKAIFPYQLRTWAKGVPFHMWSRCLSGWDKTRDDVTQLTSLCTGKHRTHNKITQEEFGPHIEIAFSLVRWQLHIPNKPQDFFKFQREDAFQCQAFVFAQVRNSVCLWVQTWILGQYWPVTLW